MDYSKLSTATLKMLKSGQKIDYSTLPTEDLLALRQMASAAPKPETTSMLESLGRGAAQGASFGFADEITGGIEHLINGKPYEQARDESRAAYEKAQNDNPGTYLVGDVGASIATGFIPGLNIGKAATLAGRVGGAAALGATAGLGYSDATDVAGMAKDTAIGGAMGGGLQFVGEKVVKPVIDKVTDPEWMAKKFGKALANVDEDVTEAYLKDPAKYQDDAVKGIDVLKDEIDANSRRLSQGRDAAKSTVQNLKDEYKEIVANKTRELDDTFRTAREDLMSARGDYARASTDLVNDLKTIKPPIEAVDKLTDAIELLSDQVSTGSATAFDTLDKEGVEMSRRHLVKLINDARKSLQIGENVPPMSGTPARKHYDQLTKTILDIRKMPTSLEGGSVKRIIQDLDDTINYMTTVGGRSGRADMANGSIRAGLNQTLRNKSQAYGTVMDDVSRKTELLTKLNKSFGTKEQILNRIMELPEESAVYKRELLQKLADETGVKVDDLLKDYMSARQLLKDPNALGAAKESLSEFGAYQKAQERLAELPQSPFDRRELARKAAEESGLPTKLSEAERMLAEADDAFSQNYVSESGSEPLVKRMLGRRGTIEDQRLMQRLGGTLPDDIQALRVNQAFTRPDVAGSRRTLAGQAAGKLIGMGVGSALGYEAGGDYGAGAGALAGFSMDRHAGKIFKALLDGSMRADAAIQRIAPNLGKYVQPLMQAAQRGNKAVAATHFILSQRDPEYRKTIEQMNFDEDAK